MLLFRPMHRSWHAKLLNRNTISVPYTTLFRHSILHLRIILHRINNVGALLL
jgi:hypothetical protein